MRRTKLKKLSFTSSGRKFDFDSALVEDSAAREADFQRLLRHCLQIKTSLTTNTLDFMKVEVSVIIIIL